MKKLYNLARNTKESWDVLDVLQHCTAKKSIAIGKQIHAHITKTGIHNDVLVGNHLINMYSKCCSLKDARQVFNLMSERNLVSWNTMITAYANSDNGIEAIEIVWKMQQEGVTVDMYTFTSAVHACACASALSEGMQVHGLIVKNLVESNVFVESALVDMYAKCNRIEDARQVFNKMHDTEIVSSNAMIAGYVSNGEDEEALVIFRQVQRNGLSQNQFTLSSALSACSSLADMQEGIQVHSVAIKTGFQPHVFVGTALVDMYAKCGSIDDAYNVFDRMPERNVVAWNAMIKGYAQHGRGNETIQLFEQMQEALMKPNEITFICVLSACSHAGLVNEGRLYFDSMVRNYGITPNIRHYACMVDLLARGGHLQEAEDLINKMPFEPNAAIWGAILGACRIHGNMELAGRAAECLFKLEPHNAANHVLLSNTYAAAGRWDDVEKVWKLLKESGMKKERGLSWIEAKNKVHVFVVGDRSHRLTEEIYSMLERLTEQMRESGYVPKTTFALHDVEEQHKEHLLGHHSEKLALAFGLIILPPEVTIRIKKNLRMCGDCHTAFKFISNISMREIIVRDTNRFHHFKSGLCSCGDYW
ncbi:pentatricopeptide repeat-containing protein At5g04780, mitochondrial [Cryptomeria japonica]|uniref:pentatricopeptide repeat-containing protein At5g04780, mitochondrial n=1 Tax=Cryptomeria japonica TaxID=3369 RepID=UPI0027DA2054|nr:pentatricopeptide repeat-containing protein At5g04780, mitochondrial [Cryptomeria japonica]